MFPIIQPYFLHKVRGNESFPFMHVFHLFCILMNGLVITKNDIENANFE
jgi:hypothetical protein